MTESNNLLSQTYLESIIGQYKSLYEGIRELIYVKYQYEYPVIFTYALFTQRIFILYNEVELHFKKLDTSSFNPIDFSIFQPIYSINAEIGKVANPSDDLSSINDRIIYYLNVAAYLKSQELLKTETDIIQRRYYDYHLSELERWFDNRNLYLAKVKATFNIQTIIQEKVIPFKEIKALLAKIENKDEISLPKYPNSEPKTEPVPEVLPDQAEIDNQKQPKSIPEIEKENVGGTDKDALNLIHGIMDKTYQGYQRHQQYQAEIDNQKQPKSIPEVKSLKKHRERQRIKEKGLEIKNRNYGISNMAIAENLHRQKSFQKYSVETLRKYYISSYWYDGKEYK